MSENLFPEKRCSCKRWGCLGILMFLAVAGLYYQLGQASRTAKIWNWNRTGQDEIPMPKPSGGFALGWFTSDVQSDYGWTSQFNGHTWFDFRSVAIHFAGEHPLEIAVANRFAEVLKTYSEIERIQFVAAEPVLCKGDEPLPGWYIRIKIDNISENHLLSRSLRAASQISFGSELVPGSKKFSAWDVSPRSGFDCDMSGNIQGFHTGFCTQSYFYNKIADAAAADILKRVKEMIEQVLHKKLPKLPAAFYPPYQEASKMPDLPGITKRSTLLDGHRLMTPHESVQSLQVQFDDTPIAWLESVKKVMLDAGWKEQAFVADEKNSYLRMNRGEETFHLFREKTAANRLSFFLERTERMNDDSLRAAIQTLFDNDAPAGTLIPLIGYVYNIKDLNDWVLERLRNATPLDPSDQFALAKFFEARGEKETATQALFRAWRVRKLTSVSVKPLSDDVYNELAKKLGVTNEMKALPQPDAELCERFDFRLLKPEDGTITLEVDADKEQRFATVDSEGYLHTISFTFGSKEKKIPYQYVATHFHRNGNNAASGSGIGLEDQFYLDRGEEGEFRFTPTALSVQRVTLSIEYVRKKR